MRLTRLLVRFSNLGSDDIIIPGMANLSFNIELSSAVDANRTLVNNIGRAIIKKLAVKFEGNEIMSIDDFDVLTCYQDLWKTKSEKRYAIRQGIISNNSCMENCIKLRINAGDKSAGNAQDKAIADPYRNKFIIPLDFKMLDSAAPYYQAGLRNRLCYAGINLTGYHPTPQAPRGFCTKMCAQPQGFCRTGNAQGAGPINDDVPGARLLHQLAFKPEN